MDLQLRVVFVIPLALFGLLHCSSADEEPHYKFILDKFEKQLEADDIFKLQLTIDKLEEGVKVSGEAMQAVDFDNDWLVSVEIYSAETADAEYELLIGIIDRGVCDVLASYYKVFFYETLKEYANVPSPEECPVVSNTYVITDYPMDVSKLSNYLESGYYRIKASLSHEGKVVIVYVLEGHVAEE